MTKQVHHINFDKLKDFAHVGVRRATIFLGLGLNAAHREDFLDYELSKVPRENKRGFPIQFFPDDLPPERVKYFKDEFARWVQDCCLCDLLEHHALTLDRIHLHALVVHKSLGKLGSKDDPEKLHNRFRYEGVPGKHKTLRERFAIDPKNSATVDQLYEARNAMTHDFGVVLPKRGDVNGNFVLRLPKFYFFGIGNETGKETPLADMIGVATTEDIALRVEQRDATYKVGERIETTVEDLEDILHFFAGWAIPSTLSAFVDFMKAHGVGSESSANV